MVELDRIEVHITDWLDEDGIALRARQREEIVINEQRRERESLAHSVVLIHTNSCIN